MEGADGGQAVEGFRELVGGMGGVGEKEMMEIRTGRHIDVD